MVVSTPHAIIDDVLDGRIGGNDFCEIIPDEADYGLVRTNSSTARSWYRILERISGAHVVMLSATRDRLDAVRLPEPFYRFTFDDAYRAGIVKRLHVRYLVPTGACARSLARHLIPATDIRIIDADGAVRFVTATELKGRDRRAISCSLRCQQAYIVAALPQFLAFRQRTGVPYVLHIVCHWADAALFGDNVPYMDALLQATRDAAEASGVCPLTNHALRVHAVRSGMSLEDREDAMHRLLNHQWCAYLPLRSFFF